jgi:2-oxoisovalerate dehydrogenase E2 component (dihydrolipoyl transacylase)
MGRYTFRLPDIGEGIAEAEIVTWHVKIGDTIEEDSPLADMMTDKATVEMESPVSGKVIELAGEAGDTVAIGSPLVVIETEGSEVEERIEVETPDAKNVERVEAATTPARAETVDAASPPSGKGRYIFRLPDIGEGIAQAEIVAWHVKVGDHIEEDAPLADVMTDKATVDMESPVSGTVVELAGEVGDSIAIGSTLVVIEVESGANEEARSSKPAQAELIEASSDPAPRQKKISPSTNSGKTVGGKALASPAVRARAEALGVDLATVTAGPDGIVRHADLDAALTKRVSAPAAQEAASRKPAEDISGLGERIKVIGLRRRIAENMAASKRNIPHFSYVEECDVTALEDLRARFNNMRGGDIKGDKPKLTLLPFMIVAICQALPRFPMINARYDDEANVVTRYQSVHLGMATQTDAGLMVPVIRDAQNLGLWDLAREISRLANAARDGSAKSDELSGSTLTITSLGPLGGVATTPVINRPEVAIIGPNRIIERPVFVPDGQGGEKLEKRKLMNVSISCDHRVVDGFDAASFVQAVKGLIETPMLLLAG